MIAHGNQIKVFSANSNMPFARGICSELGLDLGDSTVTAFADGEISVSINETVRGCDVFVVQSTCKPVNNNLMELLIMIDAFRRASAGRITAVIPYFGYARQDRKAKGRDPISAKLVANLITTAGANRVLTMDLHAAQIQGFFDIPLDHLMGNPLFTRYYMSKFDENVYDHDDFCVVSPDIGSVSRSRAFAAKVHMGLAIVDTAGSLCNAAEAIKTIGKAKAVYACATHGVLSGPALERIENSCIEELVLLNTIPPVAGYTGKKIHYLDAAPTFAKAITRIYNETSISSLF